MPEFVEVEAYRRTARPLAGGRIDRIDLRDERMLRRGGDAARVYGVLGGARVAGIRRTGKVLVLDLSTDHTVALTFGLRGRLVVDGTLSGTDGSRRRVTPKPEHVRLALGVGRHALELEDQLRMATLEIDFDETSLGPDVGSLDKRSFRALLARSGRPLKSLLMDQGRIAGIGNLVADEICFQGKVDPRRPANALEEAEVDDLWRGLVRTRRRLLERGGSHRGVLIQSGARRRGGRCPRCDAPVERVQVGGRTSYFCPQHQV